VPVVDSNPAEGAWAAAVLLHPHPDRGGDRFNSVIETLYRRLPTAGVSTLRFDFSSSEPVTAAAEATEVLGQTTTRPVMLVGYSFGADIALTIADDRVGGWFLVAPPLRLVAEAQMLAADDPRPKGLAVPEFDQFSPPPRTQALTANWANAALSVVPGADHFLAGHTDAVATLVVDWLTKQARSPQ
jgi:uncharacterized protein